MQNYNILFLLCFLWPLTACFLIPSTKVPTPNGDDCAGAHFIVDEVKGSLAISQSTVLPERFSLKLSTCIRSKEKIETKLPGTYWLLSNTKENLDKLTGAEVNNKSESYDLDNIEIKAIKMRTDGEGCLHWTEEYDYAYNSKSEWIQINRYIKGISNAYPGTCSIPIVINPWLQTSENSNIQVADYRKQYNKDANILKNNVVQKDGLDYLEEKKQKELKNKVNIIVEELNLHLSSSIPISQEKQTVTQLQGNKITAKLKYGVIDIHNNLQTDTTTNQVQQGDFTITANLLVNIDGVYRQLNTNTSSSGVKTSFIDHNLESEPFDWDIEAESNNYNSFLYLQIKPRKDTITARRVNLFEGIYPIGNTTSSVSQATKHTLYLDTRLGKIYQSKISSNQNSLSKPPTEFEKGLGEIINPETRVADYLSRELLFERCLRRTTINPEARVADCLSEESPVDSFTDGFRTTGWTVQIQNIRFLKMKEENWLFRQIESAAKISIVNHTKGRVAVNNKKISIMITDLTTGEIHHTETYTNADGNLTFNIPSKHQWYNKQRYLLKLIKFKVENKLNETKLVAINPWDYGFTHGFEADHLDEINAICLKEEEKSGLLNIFKKIENGETLDPNDLSRIHEKTFCKDNSSLLEATTESTEVESPIDIFSNLLATLKNIFNIRNINEDSTNFETLLDNKFISINNRHNPEIFIHLFRAINPYPTSIIDHSLIRQWYYNIRFRFSPRTVRYDDTARGQQNKGPLRDGLYLLQIAVIKNKQERTNGDSNMAVITEEAPDTENPLDMHSSSLAGTGAICANGNTDCLSYEDFLIKPSNIPIIVRDGQIKADIPIQIKREHLLFSNSKNTLVFRILPADPTSIVCNGDGGSDCILRSDNTDNTWIEDINWAKTITQIKPASKKQYSIINHTYTAPFIPSLWANWNISLESDESFDELKNQYCMSQLQIKNNGGQTNHGNINPDNVTTSDLETAITLGLQQQLSNEERTEIKKLLLESEEKNLSFQSIIDTLTDYMDTIKTQTTRSTTPLANGVIESAQSELNDRSDQSDYDFANSIVSYINNTISSLATEDEDLEECQKFLTNHTKNERPQWITNLFDSIKTQDHQQAQSIDLHCLEEGRVLPGESLFQTGSSPCDQNQDGIMDHRQNNLSQTHLDYFAQTNTLCTLDMSDNENNSSPSNCKGRTESAQSEETPVIATDFIAHLNAQIEIINDKRNSLREIKQSFNTRDTVRIPYHQTENLYPDRNIETDTDTNSFAERETFGLHKYTHFSTMSFSNKIMHLPQLNSLEEQDIVDIIRSDISLLQDKENIDNKTGTFLHAMCGLWFKDFLSNNSKYISKKLIREEFRQIIKNSLYYRVIELSEQDFLNNISSYKLENDPNGEDKKVLNTLKDEIDILKDRLNSVYGELNDKGYIDDLHKWADRSQSHNSSEWNLQIDQLFADQLNPLQYIKPSWEQNINPLDLLRSVFNEEVKQRIEAQKITAEFDLNFYLNETVKNLSFQDYTNRIYRITDYHPVRKCLLNPSHFFGIEKKIITEEIQQAIVQPSQMIDILASKNFLLNTQRDQGSNQQFETSVSASLGLLALTALAISGIGSPLLLVGAGAVANFLVLSGPIFGMNYSYRGYEGTGKRKLLSMQVIEKVELKVESAPINLTLGKYKECLVIRPRKSAFQGNKKQMINNYEHLWKEDTNRITQSIYKRAGLLLCAKGEEEKTIKEEYYYIYANYPINGISMDPSNHRNKPFTIALRGRKAYNQFVDRLTCRLGETKESERTETTCRDGRTWYEYLLNKHIEFADNLKTGFQFPKMFHHTGDTPGVFSPYIPPEDRDIKEDLTALQKTFNTMNDWTFMDADLEALVRKEPDFDSQ